MRKVLVTSNSATLSFGQILSEIIPKVRLMGPVTVDKFRVRFQVKFMPVMKDKVDPTEHEAYLDFEKINDLKIKVHFQMPGRALIKDKLLITDFTGVITLREDDDAHADIHLDYSNRETLQWLYTKALDIKGTNLDRIIGMYFEGAYVLSYLTYATHLSLCGDEEIYTVLPNFKKVVLDGIDDAVEVYRRKHAFDGWDTVNLTYKQLDKLRQYVKELGEEAFVKRLDQLALNRMCLCLWDEKKKRHQLFYYTTVFDGVAIRCEYLEEPGKVEFGVKVISQPNGTSEVTIIDSTDEEEKDWLHTDVNDDDDDPGENWEWIYMIFLGVNTFMLHYGDVSMVVEEKECKQQSEPRSSKRYERNSVRLFKCYTLKKNWSSAVQRKQHEIHCLAWGVRGHFRHYRNGKTIFIPSYVKGKERDKYEGKAYELIPYKDA